MSIEIQMITRRKVSKGLIEILKRQTSKDFSMKIRTQVTQGWRAKDLNIDFPLKVIPAKLAYNTGTRYAINLARNELLCHAESEYVLTMDDTIVMSPLTIETLINLMKPNRVIKGHLRWIQKEYEGSMQYDKLFVRARYGKESSKYRLGKGLIAGFALFPLHLLKKINGWDLKFDGGWGLDDNDVGARLTNLGTEFFLRDRVYGFHMRHTPHTKEKDEKKIGEGCYIYNKETGKKTEFQYLDSKKENLHAMRQKYFNSHIKDKVIRAPVGLMEVCKLL